MSSAKKIGALGEELAVDYLKDNGYEILERNFRHGRAEIDIIARYKQLLVFIEVKTRKSNAFGEPEAFLSEAQSDRVQQAAEEFMDSCNWQGDIRFDIIAITHRGNNAQILHLDDAF